MKVVVRRTKSFIQTLETFFNKNPNLKVGFMDISKIYQNEENWGKDLGSGHYQSNFSIDEIISSNTMKKDKITSTHFRILSKIKTTQKQTTINLQSISELKDFLKT